jgi:hypothetical protein
MMDYSSLVESTVNSTMPIRIQVSNPNRVFDLRTKNIFKRCQQCAPVITAQCPVCKSDEICTLTAAECEKCPQYECQKSSEAGQVDTKPATTSHKSPAPAIAGGVVGGIVLISLIVFIIWKFVLKGRRQSGLEEWDDMVYPLEKPGEPSAIPREARSRASTHTVNSMASTVLTRASNVIQIAYIPGVTQRQGDQASPDVLVPPVPPIPIPTTPNGLASPEEQHFFLPGDLRGSTYSDATSITGPRQSIAPSLARASVASSIVTPTNAVPTSVTKLKPSIISVKPGSAGSSPAFHTPPVPSVDMRRFQNGGTAVKPVMVRIPSSSDGITRSPGSITHMKPTALTIKKIRAATVASASSSPLVDTTPEEPEDYEEPPKPLGLGLRESKIKSIAESHTSVESPHARAKHSLMDDSSDDEDEADKHARSRQSLLGKTQSPFDDAAAEDSDNESKKSGKKGKGKSPFEDSNAL